MIGLMKVSRIGVLALWLLLSVACVQQPQTQVPTATTEVAATAAAETEPEEAIPEDAQIGILWPLSGPLAALGEEGQRGVALALEIINTTDYADELDLPFADTAGLPGLNGGKIEVIYADHGGNPETGLAEAERLITQEEVDMLFGALFSSVTATASEVAERYGVPFVVPDSSAPTLKQRGFEWFFMIGPTDDMFARNFALFLDDMQEQQGMEIHRVALIYENSLFGQDTANYERQYLEEAGYEIVADVPYEQGTPTLASEVARVKAANPDVILQTAGTTDAILSVQEYHAQNVLPQGILTSGGGFNTPDFLNTVGADAGYIMNRNLWALDLGESKPLIAQINELYRAAYGQDMAEMSVRGFVGMQVLADVLNRAGSTDPEAIRQALLETNLPGDILIVPWNGVAFDPDTQHNIHASGIMTQLIEGQFVTVWPFEFAATEVIWPFPAWDGR